MITFAEFQKSKKRAEGEHLELLREVYNDKATGFVYAGGGAIAEFAPISEEIARHYPPNSFHLIIANMDWVDTLEALEKILYEREYCK